MLRSWAPGRVFLFTSDLGVEETLPEQAAGAGEGGEWNRRRRWRRKGKRGRRGDARRECSSVRDLRKDCVSLFLPASEKAKTQVQSFH